ncbi:MAG: glycosyltransferase involved in cell wall biosynthesis [Verrucomicrobiales bacterium]|jgi:glycosyltransferase involved in cell wall biosynthesis
MLRPSSPFTLCEVQFDVTPARDLSADDASSTRWTVSGGRPAFDLEAHGDELAEGWYLLTTDLTSGQDDNQGLPTAPPIALRFLPGSGTVPLARRPIPVVGSRRTRVVHCPAGTSRIQLDVSPWLEWVSISRVSFRRLPAPLAASMMAADVAGSSVFGTTDRRSLSTRLKDARSTGGTRAAVEEIAAAYEHLQHRRAGDGVDYPSWRVRNATMFDDDTDRLAERSADLPGGGPTISVVMPVYNPDPKWLRAAILSVQNQAYAKWQLCLIDDASTDPEVVALLDEAASSDDRILVRHRLENGHIALATNDALQIATGEFVAFMDHDDELAPFALAAVALESAAADVLYTDEDKIDAGGRHFDPHCKPSWNPELLLGQNYMSHLTVIRRSVLADAGGLRQGLDGAQDHDLLLRVTAVTAPDRIRHIPLVAYHWRAIAGSTALAPGEKNYTEDASIRALEDRLGDEWRVGKAAAPTAYRCVPPLDEFPLVSILIPTRDRVDLLRQCTDSLLRTTYPAFEIIIIDNDSTDPETITWLEKFDNGHDHRVVSAPGPFNFSAVNNLGAATSSGDLILLLNNDTEVIEPDWLASMVRWALLPGVGAVGAKLLYPNDTIQHAGVVLGLGGLAGHGHLHKPRSSTGYFNRLTLTHEVGAVTGACLLTWRSTWNLLGGLDEQLAVAFNDVDYCLRVRHEAGERVLWTPDALLYHHESVSRGAEDDPVKVARFNDEVDRVLDRWADVLSDDPAYSPNLTLEGDSFTLARQPRLTPPWAEERAQP